MKAETMLLDRSKSTWTIGRDKSNDFVIESKFVSKIHAKLIQQDDGIFLIEDLDSKSGTFKNGLQIKKAKCILADNLKFADCEFLVSEVIKRKVQKTIIIKNERNLDTNSRIVINPVKVQDEKWTIGRGKECYIIINDSKVSAIHATLYKRKERFYLEDTGSTNGTFVNGLKIEENKTQACYPGDVLQLGNMKVKLAELLEQNKIPFNRNEQNLKTIIERRKPPEIKTKLENSLKGTRVVQVKKDEWTIGRAKNCNIVINDSSVSGQHATLSKLNGYFKVKDNNSKNGTFINGLKVGSDTCNTNDTLKFGEYVIVLGELLKQNNIPFSVESKIPSIENNNVIIKRAELNEVIKIHEEFVIKYKEINKKLFKVNVIRILAVAAMFFVLYAARVLANSNVLLLFIIVILILEGVSKFRYWIELRNCKEKYSVLYINPHCRKPISLLNSDWYKKNPVKCPGCGELIKIKE